MADGKKILIVEDEDSHYELILRGFEQGSELFQVSRVSSLREAREQTRAGHPDLIITDWRLPDGDGIELIEKDSSGHCLYPVVVMTSHGNEAWAVEAMKLGALDYFVKSPQTFAEISRLAQRAMKEWDNGLARRNAEVALQRSEKVVHEEEARLACLFRITQFAGQTIQELLDFALEEIIKLTGSKIGYVYHYHEEKREFVLNSWSKNVMRECAVAEPQNVYQLDKTGIWGEAVRQRKAIIINDYQQENPLKKGCPHGHVQLVNFLTVPVMVGEQIVAVAGVANKATDYDEADVRKLALVMNSLWQIVERMRAEEELSKSRQDWEDIFQAIGQPAMILSMDHDILAVNAATVRVTGRSAAELISRKCYEVFHADQGSVPPDCCPLVNLLRSKQTHVAEMEIEALGGCFLVSCTPVFDQTGKLAKVIHIAIDITEKQKLEERLSQTQKMEAIGTLAGGIAHDFNNILSPIVGYTELAQMRAEGDPALAEYLNRVSEAAKRATDLVRQILTFSRKSEQKKMPLQMSLVVKEALSLLRSSIPTSIEIRQEIATQALVLADPTSIHQIMMNLCTNAYQAMEKTSGILAVSLKESEFTPDQLMEEELTPGRYVVLEVSDTGCGMDKATQEKIFEPYFTTKEPGKGTGLGLAVVHGIVKEHQGRITVYSEPDRGTTFRVFLPVSQLASEDLPGEKLGAEPTARHERILFVDDEESICSLAKSYLGKYGYLVDICSNGRDALFAIEQDLGAYDLLITDMTMPGMNGKELAQKVLALRADLPVIICTGYSSLIDSEEAAQIGIRDYVEKPVGMSVLLSRIKKVLSDSVRI